MKKIKIAIWAVAVAGSSLLFSSCIGSFSLTKSVMNWNKTVGSKFVNELVFVAFWILPVYEVTSIADLLLLNSIEFWSGKSVVQAQMRTIEGNQGTYEVLSDRSGHSIINKKTGRQFKLEHDEKTDVWFYVEDNVRKPFMKIVDEKHVEMLTPAGEFCNVELSKEGLAAYTAIASGTSGENTLFATR